MATKLDRLLHSIDPSRTLDDVSARTDVAVNTFQDATAHIDDWRAFQDCLAAFYQHLEQAILRLRAPRNANAEFDWGRCLRHLSAQYGRNGDKAAFEMARTGNEGGLYAVLKAVAKAVAHEYARNEVAARVGVYWNGLTVAERLDASREYLEKHGHLLPSELTEGSAARIRANFREVLEEHPYVVRRFGRIGRQ